MAGILHLTTDEESSVLVVSGLEAQGAATLLFPQFIPVYPEAAIDRTDWEGLKGRTVYLWGQGGEDGHARMLQIANRVLMLAGTLRTIDNHDQPNGWDLPNLVADGVTPSAALKYVQPRMHLVARPEAAPKKPARASNVTPIAALPAPTPPGQPNALVAWQSIPGIDLNDKSWPHAHAANLAVAMAALPNLTGKIWFDSFREQIWQNFDGTASPLTDAHVTRLLVLFQGTYRWSKLGIMAVRHGLEAAARANTRNSLTEWLDSLVWDGKPRLANWLTTYLGCPNDEHHMNTGHHWLVSMVARAYKPGCKVDTVPVLEGLMAAGKTSTLEIIGGDWYASLDMDFGNKDFLQTIRDKWLVEIPDLAGFRGKDHAQVIAAITRRDDDYRAAYGHYSEKHARKCIIAVTTELSSDYLQEERGRRRFLPVKCADKVDLGALRRDRDQLFAEAVAAYKKGEEWWHFGPETLTYQDERVSQHPWTDAVIAYADSKGSAGVTSTEILSMALEISLKDQRDGHKTTVFRILSSAGYRQTGTTDQGKKLRIWRRATVPTYAQARLKEIEAPKIPVGGGEPGDDVPF